MKIGKNRLYINWIDYSKKSAASGGLLTKEEYMQSIPRWRFYVKIKLRKKVWTRDYETEDFRQVIATETFVKDRSFHTYTYDELLQHVANMPDVKEIYGPTAFVEAYPRKYKR